MVYGPRDEDELRIVAAIVATSHDFASAPPNAAAS
jgi:hypothetical protein